MKHRVAPWAALGIAGLVVYAAVALGACTDKGNNALPVAEGPGPGGTFQPCLRHEEGCPCTEANEERECGVVRSQVPSVAMCTLGHQVCVDGKWSSCVGDHVGVQQLSTTAGPGSVQVQSLGGTCDEGLSNAGSSEFDIRFKVNSASPSAKMALVNQRCVCKPDNISGPSWGVRLNTDGTVVFDINNGNVGSEKTLTSTKKVNDGKDHNVIVRRGSDGVIRLFIDPPRLASGACTASGGTAKTCPSGFTDSNGTAADGSCVSNTATTGTGAMCDPGYFDTNGSNAGGECAPILETCAAINYVYSNPPSGTYRIDPDGHGTGVNALAVTCDNAWDGGGWTLTQASGKGSGTTCVSNGSCVGSDGSSPVTVTSGSYFNVDLFKAIAAKSSRVHIRNSGDAANWSITSLANSPPIYNARNGVAVNTNTSGNAASYWTGPRANAALLDFGCAPDTCANNPPGYQSCINGNGLHFAMGCYAKFGGWSRWDSNTAATQIPMEMYLGGFDTAPNPCPAGGGFDLRPAFADKELVPASAADIIPLTSIGPPKVGTDICSEPSPKGDGTISLISGASVNEVFLGKTVPVGWGLKGEYYKSYVDAAQQVPRIPGDLTRVDPQVNFNFGGYSAPSVDTAVTSKVGTANFAVRWSGYVRIATAGTYTFFLKGDDGYRLKIDGVMVVDAWTSAGYQEKSGSIDLLGGRNYPIVLEYRQASDKARMSMAWAGPGITGQPIVPPEVLYPTTPDWTCSLAGACGDICNPNCTRTIDTSPGTVPGPGAATTDGGLALLPDTEPLGSRCEGIVVNKGADTITVKSFDKNLLGNPTAVVTEPTELVFKASFVPANCVKGTSSLAPARWSQDRLDVANIETVGGKGGVFKVLAPTAASVKVTAKTEKFSAFTYANVVLDITDNSKMPGITQANFANATLADSSKVLYPYNNTVFPKGLIPPTLQWMQGNFGSASAVKVSLRAKLNGLLGQYYGPTSAAGIMGAPDAFPLMGAPATDTPPPLGGAPTISRVDPQLNFNFSGWPQSPYNFPPVAAPGPGLAGDAVFGVRWTGYLYAPTEGEYTLSAFVDDGLRIWVNNALVLDNGWVWAGIGPWTGKVYLKANTYSPITIDFFNRGGPGAIQLSWQGPGIAKQIIPSANLFATVPFEWSGIVPEAPANNSAGPAFQFPENAWRAFEAALSGGKGEILLQRIVGGQPRQPQVVPVTIANETMRGSIYYWAQGDNTGKPGRVIRYRVATGTLDEFNLGTPFYNPYPNADTSVYPNGGCVMTCHSVSADGSTIISGGGRLAGAYDIKSGTVVSNIAKDTWWAGTRGSVPYERNVLWANAGISPDGTVVVLNEGPRRLNGESRWVWNARTGQPYDNNSTLPPGFAGNLYNAAFSPDSKEMYFVQGPGTAGGWPWESPGWGQATIRVLDFDQSGAQPRFSNPRDFVAGSSNANWQSIAFVTPTPDAKWIVFDRRNAATADSRASAANLYIARTPRGGGGTVEMEMREANGSAGASYTYNSDVPGLLGEYYTGFNWWGDLPARPADKTQIDPYVNFQFDYFGLNHGPFEKVNPPGSLPSDELAVRWTGYVKPPNTGWYTFYSTADDGVRLLLNGSWIINDWRWTGPYERTSGAVYLEAGKYYPIRLEFFEAYGWSVVNLAWSGPGIGKQIIPTQYLSVVAPGRDNNVNYEPTMAPVSYGGYSWVVMTSNRTYGNTLMREKDAVKQLWISAVKTNVTPAVDPSAPPFHLDGQSLTPNLRGYWAKDPCKNPGDADNSCLADDECCGSGGNTPTNACSVVSINPVVKKCMPVKNGVCSKYGQTCAIDEDCCSGVCRDKRCAAPMATYSPTTVYRDLEFKCDADKRPVWRKFLWSAVLPGDSSLEVRVRTAPTKDELASASAVDVRVGSNALMGPSLSATDIKSGIEDLELALLKGKQNPSNALRLEVTMNPSGDALSTPSILDWTATYDCVFGQ